MIRAPLGDVTYWNTRVAFDIRAVAENQRLASLPSKNPAYGPQFSFNLAQRVLRLILRRYSRGDPIGELGQHFEALLDAWELSDNLSEAVGRESGRASRRDWVFDLKNLNHYNWCFWLVAIALLLEVPDEQWKRLLLLIGPQSGDKILELIIATRTHDRGKGASTLHPKPYERLLRTIEAPQVEQALLLNDFVTHWYAELARKGGDELYWYIFGDPVRNPLSMGSYFGRWCLEAAVAVKVFGIDDRLCLGHEHYPGDFLRDDVDTPTPVRAGRTGWFGRLFGTQ